jgi:hypothetical protein
MSADSNTGAYLYRDEAGERRVRPEDFLRVPGGHKHWSGGDKTEGALFYRKRQGSSIARQRSRGTSRIFCRGKSSSKQSEQEKRKSKRERLLRLDLRKKGSEG